MAPHTESSIWLPFLFIAALLVLFKKLKSARRTTRTSHPPPGPPRLPIIGNLHQLGDLAHVSFSNLSKKYGPIMLLQLGAVPTLVVSSAEAAREILKTHDLACCSRPPMVGSGRLSYNYLDMAFAPFGDYWREVRKLCAVRLFSAQVMSTFSCVREEEVALMVESIVGAAASAAPVDLSEMSLSVTANVTWRIGFGRRYSGSQLDNDGFENLTHESLRMLQSFCAADFFPRVGWIVDRLTGFHKRLEKTFHDLDGLYRHVIDQHLDPNRNKGEQDDIVDILLRMASDETDTLRLTQDHIKAILMNIFVGGVDSSVYTLVWAMTELAKDDRAMKKAQDEIRQCIGNKGRVDESDLDKLEYLKLIIKETFRLHPPPALLLPRETMTHFKINGYDIHPKTQVHVNAWAIGRDPESWDRPEEFIPERFMGSSVDYKGQHFELLPFGGGRRGCPGIYMGVIIVELGLANLLYRFDWKLPDGMKQEDISMEEGPGLAICKKIPLQLVPVEYTFQNRDVE